MATKAEQAVERVLNVVDIAATAPHDFIDNRRVGVRCPLIDGLKLACQTLHSFKELLVIAHFESPPIMATMRSVTPFNSASISASGRGGLKT